MIVGSACLSLLFLFKSIKIFLGVEKFFIASLYIAALEGKLDVVKYLVEQDAYLEARNEASKNALKVMLMSPLE